MKDQFQKSYWQKHLIAIIIIAILITVWSASFAYLITWTNLATISTKSHQLQILYDKQWTFWVGFTLSCLTIALIYISIFTLVALFNNRLPHYASITQILANLFILVIWILYLALLVITSILINYNNSHTMEAYNPLLITVLVLSILINLLILNRKIKTDD